MERATATSRAEPRIPAEDAEREALRSDGEIQRVLGLLRAELRADACVLFTFGDRVSTVQAVAGDGRRFGVNAGVRRSLTGAPTVAALFRNPDEIRAFLSVRVPIRASGCRAVVCALRARPEPVWGGADERVAGVLAELIRDRLEVEAERLATRDAIRSLLAERGLQMVFQPVVELASGDVVAYEALARFPDGGPAEWFAAADAAGIGVELELAAVEAALAALDELPPEVRLSLNVSPEAAATRQFVERIVPVAERVIIELTERAPISDYASLTAILNVLRACGATVALDDVGAGHADLRHILNLAPDVVKLDASVTRHIASDTPRRASATALVALADGMRATLAAEGIEDETQCALLGTLGIAQGQGFYLGRPLPLPAQPQCRSAVR